MRTRPFLPWRAGALLLLPHAAFAVSGANVQAQEPPQPGAPRVVQPGAPGTPGRALAPEELRAPQRPRHTEADVAFMQNMIVHHLQALVMSALAAERTEREDVRQLAERIGRSQDAEIAFMKRWLELRGEEAPAPGAEHGGHGDHGAGAQRGDLMAGMLTQAQLAELAAAGGPEFDRLFLELMIYHHGGALDMVEALFSFPGAALDSDVFDLASHVNSDQRMEIARMRAMLGGRP